MDVLRSLPADLTFDCVIADPPYNHGIWRNEPVADYAAWCEEWLRECLARLRPGGLLYCYGWPEYLAHVAVRFPVKRQRWLQWHYRGKNVPSSKFFQRSHESILCLWHGGEKLPALEIDQIRISYAESTVVRENGNDRRMRRTLTKNGRYGTDDKMWGLNENGTLPLDVICVTGLIGLAGAMQRHFICRDCDGVFSPKQWTAHKDHDRIVHPTEKPPDLTKRLLRAILRDGVPGDVLIPFAGSGSECRVAQSMGHNYLGIELDEQWVRLARETLAATEYML